MSELISLTTSEQRNLEQLEAVVHAGQQTFIEVGKALAEIRDKRLYRQTHKTFEAYCQERWQWSRRRAYQFIESADVALNVNNCTQKPTSEGQIRPLTKLATSDEQHEAWCKANEIAEEENVPVTGKLVQQVVDDIKNVGAQAEPAIKDGIHCVVAESNADKAIMWINEISLRKPGAKAAIEKVLNHCERLLEKIK